MERSRRPLWPRIRRVWVTAGLLVTAVFVGWSLIAYRASGEARAALLGDAEVRVLADERGFWWFASTGEGAPASTGLLLFPGALVDPVAYAPLARAAAARGFPAVLVRVPRRGAFGGADGGEVLSRARAGMRTLASVERWVVAGHSKGGVIASRFVHGEDPRIGGLVLIGTSHPRDVDLSGVSLQVTKIVGTHDCVADLDKSERNRPLLPRSTDWRVLEGGNHSQFGWYGFQPGDCRAALARHEQQAATVDALLDTLQRVAAAG